MLSGLNHERKETAASRIVTLDANHFDRVFLASQNSLPVASPFLFV